MVYEFYPPSSNCNLQFVLGGAPSPTKWDQASNGAWLPTAADHSGFLMVSHSISFALSFLFLGQLASSANSSLQEVPKEDCGPWENGGENLGTNTPSTNLIASQYHPPKCSNKLTSSIVCLHPSLRRALKKQGGTGFICPKRRVVWNIWGIIVIWSSNQTPYDEFSPGHDLRPRYSLDLVKRHK